MLAACMPYREKGPLAVTHRLRWQGSLLSATAVGVQPIWLTYRLENVNLVYSEKSGMLRTALVPCPGSSI